MYKGGDHIALYVYKKYHKIPYQGIYYENTINEALPSGFSDYSVEYQKGARGSMNLNGSPASMFKVDKYSGISPVFGWENFTSLKNANKYNATTVNVGDWFLSCSDKEIFIYSIESIDKDGKIVGKKMICGNVNYYNGINYKKGAFIETIFSEDGIYPDDGYLGRYWYVKKNLLSNPILAGIRGFTFNGKHNAEFKTVMHSKSIQPPSKKKIKDSVPFMNGSYDFSTIGSNGDQIYSEREITIEIGLPADTKEELQVLYSNVLEWLEDTGRQELKFDVIKDYFYMAEVEDTSSFDEVMEFGKLVVKFIAYPFKMSVEYVGSDIWDTFNFEEDYLQSNTFDILESETITLYNPRRSVNPIINCTAPMTITKDDKTYKLSTGDNKIYGFKLNSIANTISITGTGKIKFIFRKESL